MKTIQDVRDATFDELQDKLLTYGRCMVIRPTGFGKTYMMTRLMTVYNKVLFLYPTNIIADVVRDKYDNELNNVDYMSYLAFCCADVHQLTGYDLVVCDECHRLGAEKTNKALERMMLLYRDTCHFVGLTATPQRTDDCNVLTEVYGGIKTFDYTLHDAIMDGFVRKPYYCYMSYGYIKDAIECIENGCKKLQVAVDDELKQDLVKRSTEILYNIYNRDKCIRETCDKYLDSTDYMKFICFFSTKAKLKEQSETVLKDFQNAYPDHEIRTLIITSDAKYAKNISKLDKLEQKKNTIDLIFSIDMLNMGYHVDNISGVIMYRTTDSSIIFLQQLGRCISTVDVDDTPKIVFDFVDNINRPAVYEVGKKVKRSNKSEKPDVTEKDLIENNCFTKEDVIAVSHVAGYKQLCKKIEQEPKEILSKRAYWKFRQFGGGIDRPEVKIDFFATLYGVTVKDVLRTMKIENIYDAVDESTRVPDEILNLTGKP